jgi:hypothetical protein
MRNNETSHPTPARGHLLYRLKQDHCYTVGNSDGSVKQGRNRAASLGGVIVYVAIYSLCSIVHHSDTIAYQYA